MTRKAALDNAKGIAIISATIFHGRQVIHNVGLITGERPSSRAWQVHLASGEAG